MDLAVGHMVTDAAAMAAATGAAGSVPDVVAAGISIRARSTPSSAPTRYSARPMGAHTGSVSTSSDSPGDRAMQDTRALRAAASRADDGGTVGSWWVMAVSVP